MIFINHNHFGGCNTDATGTGSGEFLNKGVRDSNVSSKLVSVVSVALVRGGEE